MIQDQKQGLVKARHLSEADLAEIAQLTTICEDYEQLHMRILWGMLRTRPAHEINDFLYYENNRLVGYLSQDHWGSKQKELTGMVHPEYRRRGIFRLLLEAARDEGRALGVESFLLVCEHASASGKAFLAALGAKHELSEHEMTLVQTPQQTTIDDRLIFRQADASDLDVLACVQAKTFGVAEDVARRRIEYLLGEPGCYFFLATFGEESVGCEEPVGLLRLDEDEEQIGIYGFGVVPDYRGRGYGRQMLEEAIALVRAKSQKRIMLDVETENTPALKLYLSSGFQIKTTYEYYAIAIDAV